MLMPKRPRGGFLRICCSQQECMSKQVKAQKFNEGEACPCCGYDTLSKRSSEDICSICWWHDDGQDNSDADQVLGGPNANLSLMQGRLNFLKFGIAFPARKDLIAGPRSEHRQLRHFLSKDADKVVEATKGKIIEGESKGMFILVQDDTKRSGGFLILTSKNPDLRDAHDDWVQNRDQLDQFFRESSWKVEWLE